MTIRDEYEALNFDGVREDIAELYRRNGAFNDELDSSYPVEIAGNVFESSFVLAKMDPDAYRNAQVEWQEARRADWLQLADNVLDDGAYPDNRARFNRAMDAAARGVLVPFVGSGLGVPCGNPTWSDFLRSLATIAPGGVLDVVERHLDDGLFEEAAQFLADELGRALFWERLENRLTQDVRLRGPILLLAETFRASCVVTTNFDPLLESAFELMGEPFRHVSTGLTLGRFRRGLDEARDVPQLLKLHGDAEEENGRVLTLDEFNEHYGNGAIDFTQPVPAFAQRLFTQPLLFVGCGLNGDRVLQLAEAVAHVATAAPPTRHYAILEAPEVEDPDLAERERTLGDAHIFPIWYPYGEYDAVEALLSVLAEKVHRR